MDFVTPIVTPIVESLLVPVKKHLGFLVSSSTFVGNMRARMAELNNASHDTEKKKERNDANNLAVPAQVPGWLAEVEMIKAKAESISTDGVRCFNMKKRYKSGKMSSGILKDIDRLMSEKARIEWSNEPKPLGKVSSKKASTSTIVDEHDEDTQKRVKSSRMLIFNDALKFLKLNDNKTHMMALCGMGGVGKTTMMEQLKKVVEDKKMFDWVVKVVIGKNRNPIDIQKTIAEHFGEPLTETDKDTRAARLQNRFKGISEDGKKRILVILDDVWEEIKLEDIGLTSPLPHGFKLLLTSRDENVCNQMGVESSLIFKIVVLNDEEAQKLFWETTGLSDEPNLYQIGEDIVRRCGGLPIAITAIAATLRDNKELDEWEDARSRLQKKWADDYNIKAIFEISYSNLKEDDLKAIFLLCGLFPEDYNIEKEDLLRYGWGMKFFQNVHRIAEARRRVNTCVNKLIRSNLLIRSDHEECVKMHDLVRDFVLSNFSEVKQASVVNYCNNVSEQLKEEESYERVLVECGGTFEFPRDFNHPNLVFLKLMGAHKLLGFPIDFYTRMEKLEVMAYKSMDRRTLLPRYSTNLRALCLRSCSVVDDDISFLGDLINLEVLSLVDCGIGRIPSKIGRLKRLKLLDVSESFELCIDDGVFQNLEKLQELYMSILQIEELPRTTVRFTDSNCDEFKMLSSKLSALELEFFENEVLPTNVVFENLEKFRISVGCLLERKENDDYRFKNTLRLVTSNDELIECKINELFRKTEILYLDVNDMNYLEDVLTHPPQDSFSNLASLHINGCQGLTYLFTINVAKGLRKLEKLEITGCRVLKSVVNGENKDAEVITFQKLKCLSLGNLPQLTSLCDNVNVMELPQLEKLDLNGLPNITSIFSGNNVSISATSRSFLKKEVMIPKLQILTIISMPNLMEIWPCEITSNEEEVHNICMLRKIKVHSCHGIMNLFPTNPMRVPSHLEEIDVIKCSSIEVIFNIDLGKMEQLNSSSSSILRKLKVSFCENLREVWRIKDATNNYSPHLIYGFQSVEFIEILYCQRFRDIVTPTTSGFEMRALKEINILGCGNYGVRKNETVNKDQEIITTQEEDISNVGINRSKAAFTSCQITHNFHIQQLCNIQIKFCKGLEVVFEIESLSNKENSVTTQQQPLLPNLQTIDLNGMETLSHVWKCSNWKQIFIPHIHQPQSSSFLNLTTIKLSDCKTIKYLFSPLMVRFLSNLKEVDISDCDGMEEVVSKRDDEDEDQVTTSTFVNTTTTFFPYLDALKLSRMRNLMHIHGQYEFFEVDSWSLCEYSRKISIDACHSLPSAIPSYTAGRMQKLQVLEIRDCASMKEIFESKENNDNNTSGCSSSAFTAPKLPNNTMHNLLNLTILRITTCNRLENVFTFSTLESLKNLVTLKIEKCDKIKVIVKEEVGEDTVISSKDVVFSCLKSVELLNLPNLAGFFLGIDVKFYWTKLDYVMIKDCPQMIGFTSGQSTAPKLKYIHSNLGKHNIDCGLNFYTTPALHKELCTTISERRLLSFHNLTECNLKNQSHTTIFQSNVLQQQQNLETIDAKYCFNLEEVFEVASEVTENESETVVKLLKLREMKLNVLPELKYIWRSNQWRTLEFPNLTTLSIGNCRSIEHVFTSSMVGCVMQLQKLHINECRNMKAIIKGEEEDHEAKANEIKFPCLKSLKLEDLWSMEGFCLGNEDFTFPSLDTLKITECSKIRVFTKGQSVAPKLTIVETRFDSFNLNEDINSFIITKTQEGYRF